MRSLVLVVGLSWLGVASAQTAAPEEVTETAAPVEAPAEEIQAAPAAPGAPAIEEVPAPEPAPQVVVSAPAEQPAEEARWYHATGTLQYRQLAVRDPDPANDRYVLWSARGVVDVPWLSGLQGSVALGLTERFVTVPDESAWLLRDMELGATYKHELPGEPLWLGSRKLSLAHKLGIYLPTSRKSQHQDLYLATQLGSRVTVPVVDGLTTGVEGWLRYYWFQYAEQAGLYGGMLPQLMFGPVLFTEYAALEHAIYGELVVGAELSTGYTKDYASREQYEDAASSRSAWHQDFGWGIYASYAPALAPYLSVSLSLEQNGPYLRDGGEHLVLVHRDETELGIAVTASY